MISNHFYIYKGVLSELDIYLSKEKRKNLNILNLPICQII
jgi:hypothetical protein